MYKVYFADMGKATGVNEMGKRPVVVINRNKDKVEVLKITSRNRNDKFHIRMNNYIINGYCETAKSYWIDKKYLLSYKRDCTTSEEAAIKEKRKKRI